MSSAAAHAEQGSSQLTTAQLQSNDPTGDETRLPSVLLIGCGEYTTGFIATSNAASKSDKPCGVVALTFFDLQQRGKVGRITLCGTQGHKMPQIRHHIRQAIEERYNMINQQTNISQVQYDTLPPDDVESDPQAYRAAMSRMQRGDLVVVTTPDDTHFEITKAALEYNLHCMCTKPLVHTLQQHRTLSQLAAERRVMLCCEYHKRFDPFYNDAMARIASGELGELSHFSAYMSQPVSQLKTFQSWLQRSASDISYYLNSHHIDVLCNALQGHARAVRVSASAAYGVAQSMFQNATSSNSNSAEPREPIADTITLSVQFESLHSPPHRGTAIFTASWIASPADVHSQQRFHFLGSKGELQCDQAHRGYEMRTQTTGACQKSMNPLYMRLQPDQHTGRFCGQQGYGYQSFEKWTDAAKELNRVQRGLTDDLQLESAMHKMQSESRHLAHACSQVSHQVSAILEAGRRSLDNACHGVGIEYDSEGYACELRVES